MSVSPKKKVRIICAPFEYLSMPSLEVATLKACLNEKKISVSADILNFKYASFIGADMYEKCLTTILGDAVFSALLFPHYRETLRIKMEEQVGNVEFNRLIDLTEEFMQKYVSQGEFLKDEIACFYIHTRQFFPSIYLAKLINETYGTLVWFGGYHCTANAGRSLLAVFPFIERIFENDVEESVINEFYGKQKNNFFELDDFPVPDYSDFWNEHKALSDEMKRRLAPHFWFQVEFSRGCWWNQCSFCSLNCAYTHFQGKSIENIVRDYRSIQSQYKTTQILVTEYNSCDNWKEMISRLNYEFSGLYGSYYLLFKVSALQNEKDWIFLKENNVSILVGVESFSEKCLKRMNKGHSVIESIQVIKYAERHGVKCCYNLMCSLPFETDEDLEETKRVISYIRHCLPPFDLEIFRLTESSHIFQNLQEYGISSVSMRREVEGILIPPELRGRYSPFFWEFESVNPGLEERKEKWHALIQEWIDFYYDFAKTGRPRLHSLLYMRKNDMVMELYDGREGNGYAVYTLTGIERMLYEYCDSIKAISEIYTAFDEQPIEIIEAMLDRLVQQKLMFKEDANYLSLAV